MVTGVWSRRIAEANERNGTELNECLRCDEEYCSAYFLQACGANRRTAGVVSDVDRPDRHICHAARKDTLRRMGTSHPDNADK